MSNILKKIRTLIGWTAFMFCVATIWSRVSSTGPDMPPKNAAAPEGPWADLVAALPKADMAESRRLFGTLIRTKNVIEPLPWYRITGAQVQEFVSYNAEKDGRERVFTLLTLTALNTQNERKQAAVGVIWERAEDGWRIERCYPTIPVVPVVMSD